jgi:hypothetical protein
LSHARRASRFAAGQDGSYLAEFLLAKGYVVHGLIRRSSSFNTGRIEHLYHDRHAGKLRLFLEYGDLSDSSNLCELLARIRPHELYNLAAQSHVKVRRRAARGAAPRPSRRFTRPPPHNTLPSSRCPLRCPSTPQTWTRWARCACSTRCGPAGW